MSYTPPPHTPFVWHDAPATDTPVDATDLMAAENDLVAYTQLAVEGLDSFLEGTLAPLDSPTFTGTPSAPTAALGTSTAQLATTAFVIANQASAGVASFAGRTGSVAPVSGDYAAAQITNAADKSSGSQQAFTGEVKAPDFNAAGLTGATAASRYAGATASGHPTTGTFAVGDWTLDQTGAIWVCTTAGSPGTWAQIAGGGLAGATTGAGAETADAGRTSTIQTPVLRDFRSIKDVGYAAKGGGNALATGGSATAASTTFTDTTNSPFVSGDTGKTIIIPGAGTGGRNFTTTITYVSATTVTLAVAATSTATGAYQFGWNDTTAIQAAETAVAAAGGGVLYFPTDTYLWSSITPGQGITRMGYGAIVYKIPGNNALFYEQLQDGVTLHVGFKLIGMEMHGEGQSGYVVGDQHQQDAVWLNQWKDVWIKDCKADGFINACFETRDSQNVWILDNHMSNCCINAGRNAVAFSDSPSGSAANLPVTNFFCIGNLLDGNVRAGGIVANITFTLQTSALNAIITGNTVVMNSTTDGAIAVEGSFTGSTATPNHKVVIANNTLISTNTALATLASCIYVQDDGGATFPTDATKIQDFVITGNNCEINSSANSGSGLGAISIFVSRVTCTGNSVVAAGTCSRCLLVKPHSSDSTIATGGTYSGNTFTATNAAAFGNIIEFNQAQNWTFVGNTVSCSSTSINNSDAVHIGGQCSSWTIASNVIVGAPNNGINIVNMTDGTITGNRIYNPNASGVTGSSLSSGIYSQGTPAGTRNVISSNTIYDDRGTHLMKWAVQGTSTTGTLPLLQYNVMSGALTAIINGTTSFSDIRGNWTDVPNAFPAAPSQPAAPATGVALTSADPFDTLYAWSISGGSMTSATYKRSGGTALAVGSMNPVRLANGDAWTPTYTGTLTVTKLPQP